jgi:hypothetical protein
MKAQRLCLWGISMALIAALLAAAALASACGDSGPKDPFVGTWEPLAPQPFIGTLVVTKAGDAYALAFYDPSGRPGERWSMSRQDMRLTGSESNPDHPELDVDLSAVLDPSAGELEVTGYHWIGTFEKAGSSTKPPEHEGDGQ